MPSNVQRRIVAASAAIGITLLSLVLIKRLRTTGDSIMQLPALASAMGSASVSVMGGAPANASDPESYDSSMAGMYAFCNSTGSCESCAATEEAFAETAEACSATGYRRYMHCAAATEDDAPNHEVRNQIPAGMRDKGDRPESGSEFDAHYSCSSSPGVDMGMVTFEWLMFALLLLSLPVVYLRKKGCLNGFWALLPV